MRNTKTAELVLTALFAAIIFVSIRIFTGTCSKHGWNKRNF